MPVRRNLIAVAVLTVTGATAAGGAAYAASGPTPTTAGKSPTPACTKVVADSGTDQDERLAAAAAKLGVSPAKLTDALVSTKQWIGGTSATPTPALVSGHVATLLGLDAGKVAEALTSSGFLGAGPAKDGDAAKVAGKGGDDKTGADRTSTDKRSAGKDSGSADQAKARAAKDGGAAGGDADDRGDQSQNLVAAAKALGVSAAQLDTALVTTKQWIGSTSAKPTPATFIAHVASLLGKPADRVQQALEANGIFRAAPTDKSDPPADKACVAAPDKAGTPK